MSGIAWQEYLTPNIIMYLVLLGFIFYVRSLESTDIHCPSYGSTKQECDEGGGMSFSHTKPSPNDTCDQLLNKIHKAVGAEPASIKWRKAFLLSSAILFPVWFFTTGTLPSWQQMYLSVLIGFVVLLMAFNYYSYHVYGVAEHWAREDISEFRAKCSGSSGAPPISPQNRSL